MRAFILCVIMVVMSSCKQGQQREETTLEDTENVSAEFSTNHQINVASGMLKRLDNYPSKYIEARPVDVWLPESYSDNKTYNVLYMHDGQMLFDSTSTWNKQEWKIDEWAAKLMKDNEVSDFIVVAIHNIPEIRWQDLFPEKAMDLLSSDEIKVVNKMANRSDYTLNGDNYLKFIVKELKPFIDKTFSVKRGREHTFIMGSSMGGLMSMYAISEYPDVFGGSACLSTHWPGATPDDNQILSNAIFEYMDMNLPKAGEHKVYFDYGNQTLDAHYPQYATRVDAILKAKGYDSKDAKNLFFEGADHSESSWNKRLDKPLVFLLGK